MNICRAVLLAALTLPLLPAAHAADDPAALTDRLHQAETDSSLSAPDLKPWHLKLDVQLFDAKGKPSEQGTIEEWWASTTTYQIAYTFPSYTAVEILNGKDFSKTKGAGSVPFLIKLLLNQVVHPMPSAVEISAVTPDLRQHSFGKMQLECIMLDLKIEPPVPAPWGLYPTYCFDPGKDSLRLSFSYGSQFIVRNAIGRFQERSIATNIKVSANGFDEATAHISVLESNSSITLPETDQTTLQLIDQSLSPGHGVIPGRKIGGNHPVYPDLPEKRSTKGESSIDALIGTDGHVHSMKLISTSDPYFAISALNSVQSDTYTPFMLNGKPVEATLNIKITMDRKR
jgi:Gram-negative bacterial TonB protein C-terminal